MEKASRNKRIRIALEGKESRSSTDTTICPTKNNSSQLRWSEVLCHSGLSCGPFAAIRVDSLVSCIVL